MNSVTYSKLNKQQVGKYAEYFVKMQLTLHGFQVYTTEVDDRGIDFVARHGRSPYLEIQVKSTRSSGYIFMQKSKFPICENLYLALVLLNDGAEPNVFYIPSVRWLTTDGVFVSRDYENAKSKPEWGINAPHKNLHVLNEFRIGDLIRSFCI